MTMISRRHCCVTAVILLIVVAAGQALTVFPSGHQRRIVVALPALPGGSASRASIERPLIDGRFLAIDRSADTDGPDEYVFVDLDHLDDPVLLSLHQAVDAGMTRPQARTPGASSADRPSPSPALLSPEADVADRAACRRGSRLCGCTS